MVKDKNPSLSWPINDIKHDAYLNVHEQLQLKWLKVWSSQNYHLASEDSYEPHLWQFNSSGSHLFFILQKNSSWNIHLNNSFSLPQTIENSTALELKNISIFFWVKSYKTVATPIVSLQICFYIFSFHWTSVFMKSAESPNYECSVRKDLDLIWSRFLLRVCASSSLPSGV